MLSSTINTMFVLWCRTRARASGPWGKTPSGTIMTRSAVVRYRRPDRRRAAPVTSALDHVEHDHKHVAGADDHAP